jgi:hypothetical protein
VSGDHELLRYLFLAFGVIAILNWSRNGRRWRHRSLGHGPDRSAQDLAALETRLATVERLEARVEELENRLDFAERLIARSGAPVLAQGE